MPYFFKWALVKVTVRQTNYIWSSLAVTFSQIHLSSKESYIFIAYQSLYWTVGKHSKLLLIGQMLLTDAYLYPAAGGPSITALGGSVGSAITAKAIIPLLLGNLICVYLFILWMDFIFMLWQFLLNIFNLVLVPPSIHLYLVSLMGHLGQKDQPCLLHFSHPCILDFLSCLDGSILFVQFVPPHIIQE